MSTASSCSQKPGSSGSALKSVPDFIPDHVGDRDVLVLGMNPSTNKKPIKNGTFCRLQDWMNKVGVPHWDFHNVVPHKTGDVKPDDVDWDLLKEQIDGRRVIICLGGMVARVIAILKSLKHPFDHTTVICIDHPSPRNRNFNDPAYETQMLKRLSKELKDAGFG